MTQHEIVDRSGLLGSTGKLQQVGWARHPLLDCNLEDARFYRWRPAQRFRVKRWDYYGVIHPAGYFSATIAHLGYAGQVFVYAVDFEKPTYTESTITIPLGRGLELPRNSDRGISRWTGGKGRLEFSAESQRRSVRVDWADFKGRLLHADLSYIAESDHESTVIVIPIGEHRFYYNRKINCMPVCGTLRIDDSAVEISPETSSGILDWGRGVWEYKSFWVWASGSGFLSDGRRIGLNLGYGFGDTSAATENTLLLDGRIHKLGQVRFEYDSSNFMRPWRMKSDRVDLVFTPFLDRAAKTNLLLIRSEVHQLFGHYSGSVADDTGTDIVIDDLIGWAEEHQARW